MNHIQQAGLDSARVMTTTMRAQSMTSIDGPTAICILAVTLFILVVTGLALGFKLRALWLERLVAASSEALQKLADLNTLSESYLAAQAPLKNSFPVKVESLSKFHRFDLDRFMRDSVLRYEGWFESEVSARLRALELHAAYEVSVERLAAKHLGSSGHPDMEASRFALIEKKLFDERRWPRPVPVAHLVAQVSYTSPAGRNHYSRRLDWNFDDLRQGLRTAQTVRARQSSAEALRARERSLMTPALRVDILRRDGFRCRMCGASADDGTSLHVDHILPVSRGGRTLPENLQALCQSCNLGKSNRFVG